MRPFDGWTRLWFAVLAGLVGWLLGLIATVPFEAGVAWRYGNGHLGQVAWTFTEGMVVWGCFTFFMAVVAWVPFVLPLALLVPPRWFVRWRWIVVPGGMIAGVLLLGWRLRIFEGSHFASWDAFRASFLIAPDVFACVFALGLAWAYVKLAGRRLRLETSTARG